MTFKNLSITVGISLHPFRHDPEYGLDFGGTSCGASKDYLN